MGSAVWITTCFPTDDSFISNAFRKHFPPRKGCRDHYRVPLPLTRNQPSLDWSGWVGSFPFLFLFCFVFLSMQSNLSKQGLRLRLWPPKGNPRGSGLLGSGERRSSGPRVNFLCPPNGRPFPQQPLEESRGAGREPQLCCAHGGTNCSCLAHPG